MIGSILRALLVAAFVFAGFTALRDPWRGPRVGAAFGCFLAAFVIGADGFWTGSWG